MCPFQEDCGRIEGKCGPKAFEYRNVSKIYNISTIFSNPCTLLVPSYASQFNLAAKPIFFFQNIKVFYTIIGISIVVCSGSCTARTGQETDSEVHCQVKNDALQFA